MLIVCTCTYIKLDTGKFHSSYIGMNVHVCGSTYENGCVVDARVLRQHIEYYHIIVCIIIITTIGSNDISSNDV